MKKKTGISAAMLSAALALTLAVGGCGSNKNAAPAAPAEPAPAPEAPAEEAPEAPVEEAPEESPEAEEAEEDVSLEDEEALAGEPLAVWLGGAEEETADMEEYEGSIEYLDGYRYDYISGDGILTVVNTGWLGVPGDGSPEDSAAEIAAWVLGEDETCADVSVESNDEYSANTTYPVYRIIYHRCKRRYEILEGIHRRNGYLRSCLRRQRTDRYRRRYDRLHGSGIPEASGGRQGS